MHFTIDFRPLETSTQKGAFRFYLGRGVVQSLAIECSATSTEFAIKNGVKWESIRKLVPGKWYTLQITIDPKSKKFSGTVGTLNDFTPFKNKSTGPSWDGVADCFICDAFGHVPGPACSRDIDNIGLQDFAFGDPGSGPVVRRPVDANAKKELAMVDEKLKSLNAQRQTLANVPAYPVAYAVSEGEPVNARLQIRGEPFRLGGEVKRRNLEVLGGEPVHHNKGSGRLELANWISDTSNPLTARVFVNRVWQWHFGRGIVETSNDFGSRGTMPTHPKLLDWLASEFIKNNWSVKSLHRLIMSSQTYRLSSADLESNLTTDPSNMFYWKFSRRPLDAESIRDSILAISGKLNRKTPQPHPFPPVNTWGYTIHNPFHAVYDSNHRSVYLMVQRNRRHPYLALFDAADPNQVVGTRKPTTTPTQALFLMNSPFIHEHANAFANHIMKIPGNDRSKVVWAFETAHGVTPTESSLVETLGFLSNYRKKTRQKNSVTESESDAWSALARVLLTSNALLFVD